MKIFCKFPTVNILKLNFWLVICIAKNFIWTILKVIFSIFWYFLQTFSRLSNSCISAILPYHNKPYINGKLIYSAFRWCTNLNFEKLTLMTGFVVQGHIWETCSYSALKCASVLECLFLFWSVWLRPLPICPIGFWHPGRPVGGKHCVFQPWKPANKLGQRSQILPDLKSLGIHLKSSISSKTHQLINLPAKGSSPSIVNCTCSTCVSSIWQPESEEEGVKFRNNLLFFILLWSNNYIAALVAAAGVKDYEKCSEKLNNKKYLETCQKIAYALTESH